MNIYIVIPIYNEAAHLERMLTSLVEQELRPDLVMLVNDNSTDNSEKIIKKFTSEHAFIESVFRRSEDKHEPGSKVVNAFYEGLNTLPKDYDLLGKFDADLVLPRDYFKKVVSLFEADERVGIAGGNLYISKGHNWVYENISKKTKVRGPIKLYRAACFEAIRGLKRSIGWDTVDELLAQYHGWKIATDEKLRVKHLKPTGSVYSAQDRSKQGQAFRKMRYGFCLSLIASVKLGLQKKSVGYALSCLRGYFSIKNNYIVTEEEAKFIRKLRWKAIRKKFF